MCLTDLLDVCLRAACVVCCEESECGGEFPEGAENQTWALC